MDLPLIDRAALPPEEHEAAIFIERNLVTLQTDADGFRSSADLYLFAHDRKLELAPQESRRMVSWIHIAGRNGAIMAYDFAMVMELINRTRAPAIWSKADLAAREAGSRLFASEFPNIAAVRNSTAHPGESAGNPRKLEKHRLAQGGLSGGGFFGAGAFLSDSMTGLDDRLLFGASYKGRMVEYELSMQKADVLAAIAQDYCKAFYPLEDAISAFQRKMR